MSMLLQPNLYNFFSYIFALQSFIDYPSGSGDGA